MAKAQYHKSQRVFVRPVGTWALIERVVPHWAKGLDEPIRVHYDVGLGREFTADELQAEEPQLDDLALPRLQCGERVQRIVEGHEVHPVLFFLVAILLPYN